MEQSGSIFQVSIDFDQSHLFFPGIIHWVLLVLAVLIVLVHGREIVQHVNGVTARYRGGAIHVDALRLLGTLGLVVVYFLSMERVGEYFPNMGLGFLLTSIVFMFVLSLLYVHDINRKKLLTILASSVCSPLVAWYVLAQLFEITLP
ncbi:MAG: tripartite tricarboxylate transporter TctB family protein [Tropicimonas sp.]|uniref:tripartite tricarboxylate transporter TctB family protein n=1 Tax=Tropicimonas sp. TaxID=2067044 RepID=UPI003A8AF718